MAEVLPPLASWATAQGLARKGKDGLSAKAAQRMREAYLGQHGQGDCVDFDLDLDQPCVVMLEVDCEHKDNDAGKAEIRTCATVIETQGGHAAGSYNISENAHYFPDEATPGEQASYITLILRRQQMPETMLQELNGKPLHTVANFRQDLREMIGERIIHNAYNLDRDVFLETIAVNGAGATREDA